MDYHSPTPPVRQQVLSTPCTPKPQEDSEPIERLVPPTVPENLATQQHQITILSPEKEVTAETNELQQPTNSPEEEVPAKLTEETQQINTSSPEEETTAETTEVPQTDEINFPKLPSMSPSTASKGSQPISPTPAQQTHFVWGSRPSPSEHQNKGGEKGKGKLVSQTPESTPITRQGYRSGRLADDFWIALNTPHTPASFRKTIRVFPILTKEGKEETMDYLVNTKPAAPKSIMQVNIAELLAGVPWTEARVRQHVVNEVAQALYKVFVFAKPSFNPLQKWKQGRWFAYWESDLEGAHTCSLFVTVPAQESKIKPKKGNTYGWSKLPTEIKDRIHAHSSEGIEAIELDKTHWFKLVQAESPSNNQATVATTHPNRFAILNEATTTQEPIE